MSAGKARRTTGKGPAYALGGNRLGRRVTALITRLRRRAFPNHWSFLFGVVSAACFGVLLVTGVGLMLFYDPSPDTVRYRGSYPLLQGLEVSKAYASTMRISFEVPGGLLLRQTHHWAALVLPASVILQILSTFFTGAFRRPRQWAWVLLVAIFLLVLLGGWSGYALPDDTLSGTGLRIVQGVMLGIPVIGTTVTWLLFGGEFPGRIIPRMYVIHLVASAALAVGLALRLRLTARHGLPQFGGPGRKEGNIVGIPMWPNAAARLTGLFFLTAGVVVLLGGTATISPVWAYGPSSTGNAFAGSQPDWYMGFLDGALRLVPPGWEIVWLGRTWTLAVLVPIVMIGLFFVVVATYPFLEARITADRGERHLLDRPRDTPTRTGVGVAGAVFYGALWLAGSADVIATQFRVSFAGVIWLLRGVVLVGPLIGFLLTRQVCHALRASDRERLRHGVESGRILRLAGGGYVEPHAQLSAHRRYALASAAPSSRPDVRRSGSSAAAALREQGPVRAAAASPADEVAEDIPLDLGGAGMSGSRVVPERYRRSPDEWD